MDFLTWQSIGGFLNSNFASAMAGALTGAFAGAMAARRITDRAKQRETMLKEIRSTNAAIMVAFAICNAGLALKKLQIHDIYQTYTAKKTELEEFLQRRAAGQQPANLPFELIEITDARVAGLMPDSANYEDWFQGFPDGPQPSAPATGSRSTSSGHG